MSLLSLQIRPRVTGNLLHCLKHGSQLGWLVDPNERSVLTYQPARLPDLLTGDDPLPTLEGIPLNLSAKQIFGWLRRTG